MTFTKRFVSTAVATALIGLFGAAQAQTTPATSPTQAQTVKPPPAPSDAMKTKPTAAAAATSPTVAQTQQPSTGTMPNSTMPMAASTSPTVDQTVKPTPTRKDRRMKKRTAKPMVEGSAGSGSGGTVQGRVEGTTNSNSGGEPSKKP